VERTIVPTIEALSFMMKSDVSIRPARARPACVVPRRVHNRIPHRQLALLEQPHQALETYPAVVFEHAPAGEIATLDALAATVRLSDAYRREPLNVLH
jgi:hypothetical protein